jgi:mono/diheme cytochrome c family protein
MSKESIARILVILLVLSAVVIIITVWSSKSRVQVIHARMPEDGGWSPGNLTAEAGKPLTLHLTSDDALHGFALGQSDQPAVDVRPGEVTEVTLDLDKPGKYTFYCTRWCGPNHWRMRGVIEVRGTVQQSATSVPPLYVQLGLDIDAEHHAEIVPDRKPSALRGAELVDAYSLEDTLSDYSTREYYYTHVPEQTWQALRADSALQSLTDGELWDLIAYLWRSQTTPEVLQEGQQLYSANCAACHGEEGKGDGIFARDLTGATPTQMDSHTETPVHGSSAPVDFTAAEHMLSTSSAHLHGKIIRGGMGTGMPYWGPIFTDEQVWALVDYLWSFQFLYGNDLVQ